MFIVRACCDQPNEVGSGSGESWYGREYCRDRLGDDPPRRSSMHCQRPLERMAPNLLQNCKGQLDCLAIADREIIKALCSESDVVKTIADTIAKCKTCASIKALFLLSDLCKSWIS